MLKAIFFDFDGTIADTLPVCVDAFRQTVEPVVGRPLSLDDVRAYFGPTEEGIFGKHFPERAEQMLKTYFERYEALQRERPDLAPGVMDLIRALKRKGVRVALVTAKGPTSCKISLDFYQIADEFETIETGSPKGRAKADSIAKALADLNLAPEEVAYVGDSPKDVVSSRKAGVAPWGAAWFESAEPEKILANEPEEIFYAVDELKARLEREFGPLD